MAKQTFKQQLVPFHDKVLTGTVLAIDPSSGSAGSMPGYAIMKSGVIVESGILMIDHREGISERLKQLMSALWELEGKCNPDLLLVEQIRGNRAHNYLRWACGCIVAAVSCPHLEISTSTWRALVTNEYVKGDEADARKFCEAVLVLAQGKDLPIKQKKRKCRVI